MKSIRGKILILFILLLNSILNANNQYASYTITSNKKSVVPNEPILITFHARQKTKGEVEVQLFPAAQLGSERDMVEGLQLGSLEMTLTSTGPLGNFVPQVKLFNLPFLFKDRKSCYAVLDGDIGTRIANRFPKVGLRSLGWFENGFRNITNSRVAIQKPGDVKGIKIRVMEDDVFILTMKALGASPLPMAFGELYTALEQKTVDAQENPLAVIYSSRFFEVQKYLAMTGHFYSPAMLLISEMTWQKLSRENQAIITAAAKSQNIPMATSACPSTTSTRSSSFTDFTRLEVLSHVYVEGVDPQHEHDRARNHYGGSEENTQQYEECR